MYGSAAPNTNMYVRKKIDVGVIILEITIMNIFLNLSAVLNFYNLNANLIVCLYMGLSVEVYV